MVCSGVWKDVLDSKRSGSARATGWAPPGVLNVALHMATPLVPSKTNVMIIMLFIELPVSFHRYIFNVFDSQN